MGNKFIKAPQSNSTNYNVQNISIETVGESINQVPIPQEISYKQVVPAYNYAITGDRGESSYEYAVRVLGFIGTEVEYYAQIDDAVNAAQDAQASAELAEANSLQYKLDAEFSANSAENNNAQTALDVVQTGEDVIQTAADRVQTGLDAIKTGEDVIILQGNIDQTALDVIQTGLDVIATQENRTQTGEDVLTSLDYKNTAIAQAEIATTQAGIATTQAGLAISSKNAAGISESNALSYEQSALNWKNQSKNSADDSALYKLGSETALGLSEDARDAANVSAIDSENFSINSENSSIASQNAKIASESARDLSVTAKNASQVAQGLSETARDSSISAKDVSTAQAVISTAQADIATAQAVIALDSANLAANLVASLEFEITWLDNSTLLATGTNQYTFTIPSNLNGKSLSSSHVAVTTVSSSGMPTFTLRNLTTGNTILSTPITINALDFNSYTAAIPHVINPLYKVISTGDRLAIDCGVTGTGTTGATLILKFIP